MFDRSLFRSLTIAALVAAGAAVSSVACGTSEGDRCNPDLIDSNECSGALTCTTLPNCALSFCCPATVGENDPAVCNACPSDSLINPGADGGSD
ncbi:MAG: hypothetical protein ACHREM_03625 [Polyangiales bacterium]